MARRRQQDALSRVVGIGGLFGTAYGYVGTSIYFVLGGIALYSLGVTPFLILVVGLVFIVTAWSYAEGSAAMPEASGVASFARRAFDPMTGFIAAWALLLDSIILVAIACSFVPYYLGAIWPQLQDSPYAFLIGIGAVALLVALNVLGLQESVRLSSLMAVLGLATLLLLIIVGFFVLLKPGVVWGQIDLGSAPTWSRLLYAVPLAAAAFIGLDAISSRAESALHPARDVPKAINVVLPLIVALSVGLGVVALSALPVDSNVVPVDAKTGLTTAGPGGPGRRTRRLRAGGRSRRHGGRTGRATGSWPRHPRPEAHRRGLQRRRAAFDAPVRHAAGQRLPPGPGDGPGRQPARRPRVAQGRSAALGRHPRRDRTASRGERGRRRLGAHHLLAGPTPPGAGRARARQRLAHDPLRRHRALRLSRP